MGGISKISGGDSVNKSISHFFIREVEKICVVFYIAVLDCEIAALVNHWQGLLHVSLVVDKLRGIIVFAHEFVDVFVAVGEQAHKICWRARGKPEVSEFKGIETVENAERIEDINHPSPEVIAVVFLFQAFHGCLIA